MKCQVCSKKGTINLNHHNLKICEDCFVEFYKKKLKRQSKNLNYLKKENLLLVVSGGKDSMGLRHLLSELGYNVDGIYINLGIEENSLFSEKKLQNCQKF